MTPTMVEIDPALFDMLNERLAKRQCLPVAPMPIAPAPELNSEHLKEIDATLFAKLNRSIADGL